MTELVDHLPASDKVPSPDKILGYACGRAGPSDLHERFVIVTIANWKRRQRECETFIAPEKSEEGKEQMLWVAVGDEALLAKLDRYKEITAKLATRGKVTDAEAEQLIGEGKPCTGIGNRFTRPRTGSPGNANWNSLIVWPVERVRSFKRFART